MEIADVDRSTDVAFDKPFKDKDVPRPIQNVSNVDTGCQETYEDGRTESVSHTYVTLNLRYA